MLPRGHLRSGYRPPRLFTLLLLFFCLFLPVPVYSGPSLLAEHAYLRKVHQFDRGAVHVFLKNPGAAPVEVEEVYLNGVRLENLPDETAAWTQVLPSPVPPGEISDLTIMLSQNAANYKLPLEIKVKLQTGETLVIPVDRINGPFKITGIYFPDHLDQVYIYLQNTGQTTLTLHKVWLSGRDVTGQTRFLARALPAGEKSLLRVDLPQPLSRGKYVSVRLETADGSVGQALVRVFSVFPITSYSNPDTRSELYFDPQPFHVKYKPAVSEAEIKSLPAQSAWYLFSCPNCTDEDQCKPWGNSAIEIIKRAQEFYRLDPSRPNHTHVCEAYKERAYFIYGEVCDIMFINPYEVVFHDQDPSRNGYYAGLGKLACEPRPLMTIQEAFARGKGMPFISPEQVRLGVYYQVAEGVKGISYYSKNQYTRYPALEQEIGRVNQELQAIKSYLKIGEPFAGLAVASRPEVLAKSIVAGDRGLVLILINTGYRTLIRDEKRETTFTPRENFTVEVEMPGWLEIKQAVEIGPETKSVRFQRRNGKIIIPVDRLELTRIFLLTAGGS